MSYRRQFKYGHIFNVDLFRFIASLIANIQLCCNPQFCELMILILREARLKIKELFKV